MTFESQRPPERTPTLSQKCFEAYREGNLRFPQGNFGIVTLVAAAAVSVPDFDAVEFSRMRWGKEQVTEIRRDVTRAHMAWGVQKIPDDIFLQNLGDNLYLDTLRIIGALAGVQETSEDLPASGKKTFPKDSFARMVAAALADPIVHAKVQDALETLASSLRAPEYAQLGEEIRTTAARGEIEHLKTLFKTLESRALNDYEAGGGTFTAPNTRQNISHVVG